VRDESAKEKRLAELRRELTERFAELRDLVGAERAHMLYPAEQVTMRECSRAYNEASKEDK
jgi:hypothetical protein